MRKGRFSQLIFWFKRLFYVSDLGKERGNHQDEGDRQDNSTNGAFEKDEQIFEKQRLTQCCLQHGPHDQSHQKRCSLKAVFSHPGSGLPDGIFDCERLWDAVGHDLSHRHRGPDAAVQLVHQRIEQFPGLGSLL